MSDDMWEIDGFTFMEVIVTFDISGIAIAYVDNFDIVVEKKIRKSLKRYCLRFCDDIGKVFKHEYVTWDVFFVMTFEFLVESCYETLRSQDVT